MPRRANFFGASSLGPFAERCPACRGPSEAGFCPGCAAEFRRIARPCRVCGLPEPVRRCPRRKIAWHVERIWTPFEYCHPLDHYLQSLKFAHGRALGRALALLLAASIDDDVECGELHLDVLVPVPLNRRRLLERGYNQAAEIALTLAAELDSQLEPALVRRPSAATPQSRLGARARRVNVAHAFEVRGDVAGARVAIVDDVVTTGSTVNALAAALLAAGARQVVTLAVARTVPQ